MKAKAIGEKFTSDGQFDPNAVSAQAGAAALLRRLADGGYVQAGTGTPVLSWGAYVAGGLAVVVAAWLIADDRR